MTIQEAQEMVEVWNLKHNATLPLREDAPMQKRPPSTQEALGEQLWELLSAAGFAQIDLTEALCACLHRRNRCESDGTPKQSPDSPAQR